MDNIFYTPKFQPISVITTISSVSGISVDSRDIYTVPSGKTLIVCSVVVRCIAANSVATNGILAIGITNGGGEIIPNVNLGVIAPYIVGSCNILRATNNGEMVVVTSGQTVKLSITTAFTATSVSLSADLIGYFV